MKVKIALEIGTTYIKVLLIKKFDLRAFIFHPQVNTNKGTEKEKSLKNIL